LAHKLAIASAHVTADVVEVSEFPDLAQRYHIYGVPKIVINDVVEFEGARPEPQFMAEVLRAVDGTRPDANDTTIAE
jgi:predicted DsbA family dithiol-disulfide isomerase